MSWFEAAKSFSTAPAKKKPPKKTEAKFQNRMNAAKFRLLNEKMYTLSPHDAFEMFAKDPSLASSYHQGYRQQAHLWPEIPLKKIGAELKELDATSVADMGCGEAKLQFLAPQHTFHNIDYAPAPGAQNLTVCEMSKTPLKKHTVGVVVFSLSLMSTSGFYGFLKEARRILKPQGLLKIAEVRSRLTSEKKFIAAVEASGFKLVTDEPVRKKPKRVKTVKPEDVSDDESVMEFSDGGEELDANKLREEMKLEAVPQKTSKKRRLPSIESDAPDYFIYLDFKATQGKVLKREVAVPLKACTYKKR